MKRTRFSEEPIIGVLKGSEAGAKIADLARRHSVSEATIYNWKAKYGGLEVSQARRLKELEGEDAKLKRLLTDTMPDHVALTRRAAQPMILCEKVQTPTAGPKAARSAYREAVAHLWACHGRSQRRTLRVIAADRKHALSLSKGACAIVPSGTMMGHCAGSCANWVTCVVGSAIAACTSCCADGNHHQPQEVAEALHRGRSGGQAGHSRKRAVGTRTPPPVLALPCQHSNQDLGASAPVRFAPSPCTTRWPQAGASACSTWSIT